VKEWVITLLVGAGFIAGSFQFGRIYEKTMLAERAKTAVEKQMRARSENELEVRKMGDVARCAAIGGKLYKNGDCR